MQGSAEHRSKTLSFLVVFAFCALVLRAADISTGMGLFSQTAVAQESAQDAQATGQDAQASDTNAAGSAADNDAASDQQRASDAALGGLGGSGATFLGRLPTNEELELISQLRDRREELDRREQRLDIQEQLLAGTEKRISDKISQLEVLETQIKAHLRLFEEREAAQLEAIVKVYETMKPKEAAPRFEALAIQTQLDIVTRMKPAKVAAIMAKMTPRGATTLTTELATLGQPPNISELDAETGR